VGKGSQKDASSEVHRVGAPAVPERVSVALGEIAADMREGLLALAVGAGLQVMTAMMDADVTAAAGPKGRHDPARTAVRHGREDGSVTLGGRRVPVRRPRMRTTDGSAEPVPSYELFNGTEVLGGMAMERMLAGLATRRYEVGLEPVGEQVEATSSSTSKSAVSRKFVRATETALAELLAADLSGLELAAIMIDGVHFGESCCVVALGIDIDGVKHPLSLVEGSTENTTLTRELLVGLRERGLDTTRPVLAVLDGGKALRAGVCEVFDHPVIQRCQLHKIRNVADHLPQKMRSTVASKMRTAYHADSALAAQAALTALAAELDRSHPSAAASVREGLADTLTVLNLGVPPTLVRTLRSTNAVESMIGIARSTSSAGVTGRWRCAGARRAWSRPASSSAASTATCTSRRCGPRSSGMSPPRLSDPTPTLSPSAPPDQQRAAAEVPRNSGQPQLGELTLGMSSAATARSRTWSRGGGDGERSRRHPAEGGDTVRREGRAGDRGADADLR
jgi:putative transposase